MDFAIEAFYDCVAKSNGIQLILRLIFILIQLILILNLRHFIAQAIESQTELISGLLQLTILLLQRYLPGVDQFEHLLLSLIRMLILLMCLIEQFGLRQIAL